MYIILGVILIKFRILMGEIESEKEINFVILKFLVMFYV